MIENFPVRGTPHHCVFKWLWTFAESGMNTTLYKDLGPLLTPHVDPKLLKSTFRNLFGFVALPVIAYNSFSTSHILFSSKLSFDWQLVQFPVGSEEERMILYSFHHSNLRRFSPLVLSGVDRQRLANYCIDHNLLAHELPEEIPQNYPIRDDGLCLNHCISRIREYFGIPTATHQLPFTYNLLDLMALFGTRDSIPIKFTRISRILYHVDFDLSSEITKTELCIMASSLGPIWFGSQTRQMNLAISNQIPPSAFYSNKKSFSAPRYHPSTDMLSQFLSTGYLTTRKYSNFDCLHQLLPNIFKVSRPYSCFEFYVTMKSHNLEFIQADVEYFNSACIHVSPSFNRVSVELFKGIDCWIGASNKKPMVFEPKKDKVHGKSGGRNKAKNQPKYTQKAGQIMAGLILNQKKGPTPPKVERNQDSGCWSDKITTDWKIRPDITTTRHPVGNDFLDYTESRNGYACFWYALLTYNPRSLIAYTSKFRRLDNPLKKNHTYEDVKDDLINLINGTFNPPQSLAKYGQNIDQVQLARLAKRQFFSDQNTSTGIEPQVAAFICMTYGIPIIKPSQMDAFQISRNLTDLQWTVHTFKAEFGLPGNMDLALTDYITLTHGASHGLIIDTANNHVKQFRIHGTDHSWPTPAKEYNTYYKLDVLKNACWFLRPLNRNTMRARASFEDLYGDSTEYEQVYHAFLNSTIDSSPTRLLTLNEWQEILMATSGSFHCVDLTNKQNFTTRTGQILLTYKDGQVSNPDPLRWQIFVEAGRVPPLDTATLLSPMSDPEHYPSEWAAAWRNARTNMTFSYADMIAHVYSGIPIAELTPLPSSPLPRPSAPSISSDSQINSSDDDIHVIPNPSAKKPKPKWSENSSSAFNPEIPSNPNSESGRKFKEEYKQTGKSNKPKGYKYHFDRSSLSKLYDTDISAYQDEFASQCVNIMSSYDMDYTHCIGHSKRFVNAFDMGFESMNKLREVITNDSHHFGVAEKLTKYGHPLLRSIVDYYTWLALQSMGQERFNDFGSKWHKILSMNPFAQFVAIRPNVDSLDKLYWSKHEKSLPELFYQGYVDEKSIDNGDIIPMNSLCIDAGYYDGVAKCLEVTLLRRPESKIEFIYMSVPNQVGRYSFVTPDKIVEAYCIVTNDLNGLTLEMFPKDNGSSYKHSHDIIYNEGRDTFVGNLKLTTIKSTKVGPHAYIVYARATFEYHENPVVIPRLAGTCDIYDMFLLGFYEQNMSRAFKNYATYATAGLLSIPEEFKPVTETDWSFYHASVSYCFDQTLSHIDIGPERRDLSSLERDFMDVNPPEPAVMLYKEGVLSLNRVRHNHTKNHKSVLKMLLSANLLASESSNYAIIISIIINICSPNLIFDVLTISVFSWLIIFREEIRYIFYSVTIAKILALAFYLSNPTVLLCLAPLYVHWIRKDLKKNMNLNFWSSAVFVILFIIYTIMRLYD